MKLVPCEPDQTRLAVAQTCTDVTSVHPTFLSIYSHVNSLAQEYRHSYGMAKVGKRSNGKIDVYLVSGLHTK